MAEKGNYPTKHLVANNQDIALITSSNQALNKINILDFDLYLDQGQIKIIDNIFKTAAPDQKFLLVINSPAFINSQTYKTSYVCQHVYQTRYFKTMDAKDTALVAQRINSDLNPAQIGQIYQLSGGIGQLVKILSSDPSLLTQNIINYPTLIAITREYLKTPDQIKTLLGLDVPGGLLKHTAAELVVPIEIEILPDLMIKEEGIIGHQALTKTEADILREAIISGGFISKEKISDIKWGQNSYDSFSDQAINQTIKRINMKLQHHRFKAKPRLGYTLIRR